MPKVKLGIMAKPSTRMTATLAAMTDVPMELVRLWTIIAEREKIACVMPAGTPSEHSRLIMDQSGFSVCRFTSTTRRIRHRRTRHMTPDTACAIMVAQATPATPMRNWLTNRMSSTMFRRLATSREISGIRLSPSPRSTPARML